MYNYNTTSAFLLPSVRQLHASSLKNHYLHALQKKYAIVYHLTLSLSSYAVQVAHNYVCERWT